jgi:hypothetical protein
MSCEIPTIHAIPVWAPRNMLQVRVMAETVRLRIHSVDESHVHRRLRRVKLTKRKVVMSLYEDKIPLSRPAVFLNAMKTGDRVPNPEALCCLSCFLQPWADLWHASFPETILASPF